MGKTKERTQSEKFIDRAREVRCDEVERAFGEQLGKIASAKPSDPPKISRKAK